MTKQNPLAKFVVNFQLEQLSSMALSARAALERRPPGYAAIANRHLDRATEAHDDALASLRYNKFAQAENILKDGLMHAYFAYRLAHRQPESGENGPPEKPVKVPEAEERIAYLGTTLAALKSAIEFSNCLVSRLAADQIAESMRLYNDALTELKLSELNFAKRAAQAGILQAAFASQLIEAENGGVLPRASGLANLLTVSPIRKLNQLAGTIVQVHLISGSAGNERKSEIQAHLAKAVHSLNSAIRALAKDNIVYAQARVVSGLNELSDVRALIEPNLPDSIWEDELETQEFRRKYNATGVELLVSDINGTLERSTDRIGDNARNHLESLLKNYSRALTALEAGNHKEAQRLLAVALTHADQARNLLFRLDGSPTIKLT